MDIVCTSISSSLDECESIGPVQQENFTGELVLFHLFQAIQPVSNRLQMDLSLGQAGPVPL
jgi:hypothetical protein